MKKWMAVLTLAAIAGVVFICVVMLQRYLPRVENGNTDTGPGADPIIAGDGPWGQLEYASIVISPPLEYAVEIADDFSTGTVWHFPDVDSAGLSNLLKEISLEAPLREKLLSLAKINTSLGGMSIYPPKEFVLSLSSESRSVLYVALCSYMENGDHQKQFAFRGSSTDQWFAGSAVSPKTRKLVEPLIYQRQGFMYFADLRSLAEFITSRGELLRLVKTLSSEATFIVHLKLSADSDLESLVNYWGRGGRAQEVRPILESLVQKGGNQRINIVHLLPPLPRRKLYTYQAYSDGDIKQWRDCNWTAVNFFQEVPDDRFCKPGEVVSALRKDYYQINDKGHLGDIAIVLDANNRSVHAAVYIADDIFFHRCGPGSSAPWTLARGKDLVNYYPRSKKTTIRYYRRKDL